MHTHAIVVSIMRRLTRLFDKSPQFRETFTKDVVQPLAHVAFGASLRTVVYTVTSVAVLCVALLIVLTVVSCLTYVQVSRCFIALSASSSLGLGYAPS